MVRYSLTEYPAPSTHLCAYEGGTHVERTLGRLWDPVPVDTDEFLDAAGQLPGVEVLQRNSGFTVQAACVMNSVLVNRSLPIELHRGTT